jgi:20S proteasome alpha/beta subunit
MTVCIGLVCDHGKHILLGADMRASYGSATTNDQTAKVFDLPANLCAAISGTISQCEDVISELHHRMTQLPQPEIAGEQVRQCVRDSYFQVYSEMADRALRNDLRITFDQYLHDKALVMKVRRTAENVLKALEVDVGLIVAGFYKGQPIQLVVEGGTSLSARLEISPGNAVIGSGSFAALNWLNYRRQNISCGLARSLFHLTEAKQFAEVEHGVGPLRQMLVMWPGGWKGLEGGSELIQGWWNRYGLPISTGLEDDKYNQAVRDIFGLG